MCCTCIMSDNVLAVGLFWRNDLGCASVVPSEQTSSSYIILDTTRAASCRGAPQAWYHKRRHRTYCFQTISLNAFPKKQITFEVRGQLMQSNQYRSSPASIYMLSVTDSNQKYIFEVRVHAGVLFEHPGYWSIAKCSRRSMKFSW